MEDLSGNNRDMVMAICTFLNQKSFLEFIRSSWIVMSHMHTLAMALTTQFEFYCGSTVVTI